MRSSGFYPASVRAVSPHEEDPQGDKEQEGGGMRVEEEMFEKAFGQSMEETLRETSETGIAARARKVEVVPSRKEV